MALRNSKMIKLLALDLDGTLLSSDGKVSHQNLRAIRSAEELGVLVTIATGRRFRDARPVGLEIKLNAPMVCHNGALIKFAESLETLAVSLLSRATLHEILRVGRKFGADALMSCDPEGKGVLFYERVSAENLPLLGYIDWSRKLHGDEAEDAIHHTSDLEQIIETFDTVHVSFSGSCEPMQMLQRILESELAGSVNVLATIYPHLDFTLLDILPPGASKGAALETLALEHNFLADQIMVIGDNYNDLEMLEYAGTSVVMGNASPELLEKDGFETTLSNDENGVARAIERFILGDG